MKRLLLLEMRESGTTQRRPDVWKDTHTHTQRKKGEKEKMKKDEKTDVNKFR